MAWLLNPRKQPIVGWGFISLLLTIGRGKRVGEWIDLTDFEGQIVTKFKKAGSSIFYENNKRLKRKKMKKEKGEEKWKKSHFFSNRSNVETV